MMAGTTTHGLSRNPDNKGRHTRLYGIWANMKYRCYNKNSKDFPNYGRRGIAVCEEWRNDYKAFYEWSMKNGYEKDLQLDRVDNDGDYAPSNCRWATPKQNSNNRRNKVLIHFCGETHGVQEWSEMLGISMRSLYSSYEKGKAEQYLRKKAERRGLIAENGKLLQGSIDGAKK